MDAYILKFKKNNFSELGILWKEPMDNSWYDNNSKLSVMGIICLIIFLVLLFFSLFIMPFLI
ncbi:TPA: hypothetical protein JBK23_17350, partial [Legionella pneumophila]|nr:hypothetical protein [Legionella pneumophila]